MSFSTCLRGNPSLFAAPAEEAARARHPFAMHSVHIRPLRRFSWFFFHCARDAGLL
ncbi:hypothetical protein ASZ90_003064 [hydrocarbon metagenome]|uniref:Uncharacterized protein n=1 Tax=hydrocarbon metagenome TaxID=938273 RepID=A0A0W8G1X3_9ZZZZ